MSNSTPNIVVCAMYKFVTLEDFEAIQKPLLNTMENAGVRGTLLLAKEGINGTVAGTQKAIDTLLEWFENDERLAGINHKESYVDKMPFYRTKVKLKREIVTMGIEGIDPNQVVGTYVKPKDWNALISDPDVVLVDTRNEYEYEIGSFEGAVNPHTDTFREFPDYVKKNLDPEKNKKVAMFCTGGIRCEKSTAYLKEQGFDEVYHLEGGILKYLEEVPEEETMWQGECFVFDNRVAVNHQLEKGQYDQCHACRFPITDEEKKSEAYIEGVQCPRCVGNKTADQLERFAQRQLQMKLAEEHGQNHIGDDAQATAALNKQKKIAAREANQQKNQSKSS